MATMKNCFWQSSVAGRKIFMKKSFLFAMTALAALAFAGCATTSGASSSSTKTSSGSSSGSSTAKKVLVNALTEAGKNTWYKKTSGNYVYYILYSDSAVTSGVRSDVTINKGLTILVTTSSANPINGLASTTFAVKSFGQTATESDGTSSQTFTLNDGAWTYFYTKNASTMTALSSLPDQLKVSNSSRYTNVTHLSTVNLNWKQILVNYLEGSL